MDAGVSGAKDSRPELNRLMADAHRRRFDAVICWRFDRFARSVSHLLRALEAFQALGIEFVSLSEQIDTSTPTGKMVFTILGAVADRVKAGTRNARAKRKRIGRPPITFLASETRQAIAVSVDWQSSSALRLVPYSATSRCTKVPQTSPRNSSPRSVQPASNRASKDYFRLGH